jgi:hypothetical protein
MTRSWWRTVVNPRLAASGHSDDSRVIPPAGDATGQAILPADGRRSELGLDPEQA